MTESLKIKNPFESKTGSPVLYYWGATVHPEAFRESKDSVEKLSTILSQIRRRYSASIYPSIINYES